jgi:hypothetical protein
MKAGSSRGMKAGPLMAVKSKVRSANILIPRRKELEQYLSRHTRLARIIPQVCAAARETFGPEVELSLELYKDPEIDDRYATLYVRQEQYDPSIMERINAVNSRFDEELSDVSGYLLITTDFRRPGGRNAV